MFVVTHTREHYTREVYLFEEYQSALRKKQSILKDYLYSGDSDIESQGFSKRDLSALESFLNDFDIHIRILEEK